MRPLCKLVERASFAAVVATIVIAVLPGGMANAQDDSWLSDLRAQAEGGDADARYNLGVMHHNGEGVSQDYQEAVRWYRLAADKGSANAQYNLGVMYDDGEGVPRDAAVAHMWLSLGAVGAIEERRYEVVRARDEVAARMTPAALMEAQRLAREWQPESR